MDPLGSSRWVFKLGDAFHVTELYVGILVLTWRERQKDSPLDFVADTTDKFISITAKDRIHFPLQHKDEDECYQPVGKRVPLPLPNRWQRQHFPVPSYS